MKAPQQWRLERRVYNGFLEEGMSAARKRKNDDAPPVKAFIECVIQVPDPILTLLRFEAFKEGWEFTIWHDRQEQQKQQEEDE